MLHPTMFPVELIIASHDKFLTATDKVITAVAEKVHKFPSNPTASLMRGLINEGAGLDHAHDTYWEDALRDYRDAADSAAHYDWQPRWRMGLLLQRMGRYVEGNETLSVLFRDFTSLEEAYTNLAVTSSQQVFRGPVIHDPNLIG